MLTLNQVLTAYRVGVPVMYRSRSGGASRKWKRVLIEDFHETGRRVLLLTQGVYPTQRMRVCWVKCEFRSADEPIQEPKTDVPLSDTELLGMYDKVLQLCAQRGIDPVRRVRIITTEVPL